MWRTKNRQKQIRIEKVMTPQNKRGGKLKKNKSSNTTKAVLNHPKNSLSVGLLLIEFQDDL
jgi:hypothetical protein